MTEGPHEPPQRIRIGALAERTQFNAKTIRYYEQVGLLPAPRRTASGYRAYTQEDIARLEFIRAAKDFGFTLSEIREILAVRDRGEAPCPYVLTVVRQKLSDLQDRIRRLELVSHDLEAVVDTADMLPAEILEQKSRYCHVIENRRLQDQATPPQ